MTIKQHLFNGYSVAGETHNLYFTMQNLNRATIVSGKDYKVTDRTVQENDIITIDLSPQKNNIWGIMQERLYLKMAFYVIKLTK